MNMNPSMSMRRTDLAGWVVALVLTVVVTAGSLWITLQRYHRFETGWSWDLAFYNQWCWAITHGDSILSVRPIAAYAVEGPSVWKTNYLSPARYALLPIYRLWPSPVTLLVIHGVVFWWVLPAAYGLVRHESGSALAGVLGLPLILLTPLVIPLALNDFRELQLGLPFAIWAVDGVRGRCKGLTILGVLGLLACRQEFAVWVAMLAFVPARAPEEITRRFRWCAWLWFVGLVWLIVAFFGFLVTVSGWSIPMQYLRQFQGSELALGEILTTAFWILILGLGSWVVLGLAVPRLVLLTLPWLWSLASGRYGMHLMADPAWHHVRYAVPFLASGLAASLIGYSKGWLWAAGFGRARSLRALLVLGSYVWMVPMFLVVQNQFRQIPWLVAAADVEPTWRAIAQVQPNDGVVAHYDLTAPLSSRRWLYSYILDQNKPAGYPHNLPATIQWVFIHPGDIQPDLLANQGFRVLHDGPTVQVYQR